VYHIKYSILLYFVALVCAGCGGQPAAQFALDSATFSANGALSNQQVLNGYRTRFKLHIAGRKSQGAADCDLRYAACDEL
jgi:hypothetical protein